MRRNGLIALMLVFLVACGASQLTLEELGKNEWKLISLDNQDPVSESTVTLNFYADNLNGTTGCNAYSARYELKGDKISILELVVTEQACENPPGIMEQERIYTEFLRNAARILVEDDQLMLLAEDEHFLLFAESLERGDGE